MLQHIWIVFTIQSQLFKTLILININLYFSQYSPLCKKIYAVKTHPSECLIWTKTEFQRLVKRSGKLMISESLASLLRKSSTHMVVNPSPPPPVTIKCPPPHLGDTTSHFWLLVVSSPSWKWTGCTLSLSTTFQSVGITLIYSWYIFTPLVFTFILSMEAFIHTLYTLMTTSTIHNIPYIRPPITHVHPLYVHVNFSIFNVHRLIIYTY
jgi:hypothetical protein